MRDSGEKMTVKMMLRVSVATVAMCAGGAGTWAATTAPVVLTNVPVPEVPLSSPQKIDLYWDVVRPELPPGVSAGVLPCVATKVQNSNAKIQVSAAGNIVYGFGFTVPDLKNAVGTTVPVSLAFDREGPFLTGNATVTAPGMIVLNVSNGNSLYDRLAAASYLTLSPSNREPVRYDIAGIRTALGEAEVCYTKSGGTPPTATRVIAPPAVAQQAPKIDAPIVAPVNVPAPVMPVEAVSRVSEPVMMPRTADGSLGRPAPTLTQTVNVPPPKLDTARIMSGTRTAMIPTAPTVAPVPVAAPEPVVNAAPVEPVQAAPVVPAIAPAQPVTPSRIAEPAPVQVPVNSVVHTPAPIVEPVRAAPPVTAPVPVAAAQKYEPIVTPLVDATPPVPVKVIVAPPAYGSTTIPAAPGLNVMPSAALAPDAPKVKDIADAPISPPKPPMGYDVGDVHQLGDGSVAKLDDSSFVSIEPPSPNLTGDVTALTDTGRALPPPDMSFDTPALIPPKLNKPMPDMPPTPIIAAAGQGTSSPEARQAVEDYNNKMIVETSARPEPILAMPQIVTPVPAPVAATTPRETLVVQGPATSVKQSITWNPAPAQQPQQMVDTFRARQGESLRDVLRRWSSRAGIDLVWTMPSDIMIDRDFSYVGDFRTALDKIVSLYPESGIKATFAPQGVDIDKKPFIAESQAPSSDPVYMSGDPLDDLLTSGPIEDIGVEPVAPPPPTPPAPIAVQNAPQVASSGVVELTNDRSKMAANPEPKMVSSSTGIKTPVKIIAPPSTPAVTAKAPAAPVGPVHRWRALQGASMHEVLQAWTEDSGVALLWLAPGDFAVRHSVSKTTDYSTAVLELLNQYAAERSRPVGQIYQEPGTGRKTLVVRQIN